MRLFVNSVPKSGTNLLEKLVQLIGVSHSRRSVAFSSIEGRHSVVKHLLRTNHFSGVSIPVGLEMPVSVSMNWLDHYISSIHGDEYLSGHAAYSEQFDYLLKLHGIKTIQIYRDPRAVLVSWAKYVSEDINKWYPFHATLKKKSLQERIRFLVTGGAIDNIYYSSFNEVLQRSGGWLNSQNTQVLRFEDLVGEKGGGCDEIQRETIAAFLQHIGKVFNDEELGFLQSELYGGTHTFRSGQIDGWKEYIDEELNSFIINSLKGSVVVQKLGYNDFI